MYIVSMMSDTADQVAVTEYSLCFGANVGPVQHGLHRTSHHHLHVDVVSHCIGGGGGGGGGGNKTNSQIQGSLVRRWRNVYGSQS